MERPGSANAKPGRIMKNRHNHKPPREGRLTKENVTLKRENNQLRRRVSKILKELERLELFYPEDGSPIDIEEDRDTKNVKFTNKCQKCQEINQISTLTTPIGKVMMLCRKCKHLGAEDEFKSE